jgi:CubicO group peptidase (beta-lactamase class C family)
MPSPERSAFDAIADWPVEVVAAAIVGPAGEHITFGDVDHVFELASLTKLMTAMAALIAHEEGTLDLDTPATKAGATTADLLAHSAGIAPDERRQMSPPHRQRIYSTTAYEIVAELVAEAAGMTFADYLSEAVFVPLGMSRTGLHGSAGAGARSTVHDLLRLAEAWRTPILVDATTLDRATTPHLPDLDGVLPGFGRRTPNLWGLGPEIRGDKSPHWTAAENSAGTYGHFGRTGTMMWTDPAVNITVVALTDRAFGPWAIDAWPRFSALSLAGWVI